jgi:hypothetical protein
MYDLIVGGFIPGTNIQISLQAYLAIITLLLGSSAIIWIENKNRIIIVEALPVRVTLNANDLHYRIHPMELSTARTTTVPQVSIADFYSHYLQQARAVVKNILQSYSSFHRQ